VAQKKRKKLRRGCEKTKRWRGLVVKMTHMKKRRKRTQYTDIQNIY
jgi:hypothetical protein